MSRRHTCPTCGPAETEQHPRRVGVTRCANCKEWLLAVAAPIVAVVNALYPNETLNEIPPLPNDIRVQTARLAIDAYLAATANMEDVS